MKKIIARKDSEGGFILISLAIFLIVIGLAISAYVYGVKTREAEEKKKITNTAFSGAMNKMANYLSTQGRLPCPAARNLAPDSPQYGLEGDCTSTSVGSNTCSAEYCVVTNGSKRIRIGVLPFKTLKIDKTDAIDAYGNYFTYAVTEVQATSGYVKDDTGAGIRFKDIKDEIVGGTTVRKTTDTVVNFALVSHGPDGAGSYMPSGRPNPETCSTTAADRQNCDFTAGVYNPDFLSQPYSTANSGEAFDDQVETVLLDWLYIWDSTYGDYKGSYSQGELESKMGVGTEDPKAKLHVGNGGSLRIENGNLSTKSLCDENRTNCFKPLVLGGDSSQTIPGTAEKKGMACPDKRVMIDIRQGKAICGTFSSPRASSCGEDEFFGVISYVAGVGLQATCVHAITGVSRAISID